MCALNISQLPQQKQDQLLIAGLTRKVEQLQALLTEQSKSHQLDTAMLRTENVQLRRRELRLADQLKQLPRQLAEITLSFVRSAKGRSDQFAATMNKNFASLATSAIGINRTAKKVADHNQELSSWRTVDHDGVCAEKKNMETVKVLTAECAARVMTHSCWAAKSIDASITGLSNLAKGHTSRTEAWVTANEVAAASAAATAAELGTAAELIVGASTESLLGAVKAHGDENDNHAAAVMLAADQNAMAFTKQVEVLDAGCDDAMRQEPLRFIRDDLQRDVGVIPEKKTYDYPVSFSKTPASEVVLTESLESWNREVAIKEKKIAAGPGVDYPGIPGGADDSIPLGPSTEGYGITKDQARRVAEALADSDDDA